MKNLLYATVALTALALGPAKADVILGGQTWTGTGTTLTLTPVVPGGNQPLNAPCLICGENQPQQPAGFGYNDYRNGGNVSSITAFSDQGNGGRNTLADNTFVNDPTGGYQIGSGSLFLAFLLANGATPGSLGFSIGIDVNDASGPQTLNSFFFLDLTQHLVLSSYVCTAANCDVPSAHNGTGFPDYTLTGLTLNGIRPGDEVIFAARMTNLNDGPDSFFLAPGPTAAVPGPIAGAGIPGLIAGGLFLLGLARRRRQAIG
jgi:hypothetical protein